MHTAPSTKPRPTRLRRDRRFTPPEGASTAAATGAEIGTPGGVPGATTGGGVTICATGVATHSGGGVAAIVAASEGGAGTGCTVGGVWKPDSRGAGMPGSAPPAGIATAVACVLPTPTSDSSTATPALRSPEPSSAGNGTADSRPIGTAPSRRASSASPSYSSVCTAELNWLSSHHSTSINISSAVWYREAASRRMARFTLIVASGGRYGCSSSGGGNSARWARNIDSSSDGASKGFRPVNIRYI